MIPPKGGYALKTKVLNVCDHGLAILQPMGGSEILMIFVR